MTDIIGRLWHDGEQMAKSRHYHDALLHFQRAKTLLIKESEGIYEDASKRDSRISKVLGEIMEKLQSSISRVTASLSSDPELALHLKPGYCKSDVKKAYRKAALKYHPDKNTDCDTTSIFTAVQSAYEKLLQTAPLVSVGRPTSASESAEHPHHHHHHHHQESAPSTDPTKKATAAGASSNKRSHYGSGGASSCKYSYEHIPKDQQQPPRQQQDASSKTQQSSGHKYKYPTSFSSSTAQASNPAASNSKGKQADDQQQNNRAHQHHAANSADKNDEQQQQHDAADVKRKRRVDALLKEVPQMNIAQLKRLMTALGISLEHCIERNDMVHAIFVHLGVHANSSGSSSSSSSSSVGASNKEVNDGATGATKQKPSSIPGNSSSSTAGVAQKSSYEFSHQPSQPKRATSLSSNDNTSSKSGKNPFSTDYQPMSKFAAAAAAPAPQKENQQHAPHHHHHRHHGHEHHHGQEEASASTSFTIGKDGGAIPAPVKSHSYVISKEKLAELEHKLLGKHGMEHIRKAVNLKPNVQSQGQQQPMTLPEKRQQVQQIYGSTSSDSTVSTKPPSRGSRRQYQQQQEELRRHQQHGQATAVASSSSSTEAGSSSKEINDEYEFDYIPSVYAKHPGFSPQNEGGKTTQRPSPRANGGKAGNGSSLWESVQRTLLQEDLRPGEQEVEQSAKESLSASSPQHRQKQNHDSAVPALNRAAKQKKRDRNAVSIVSDEEGDVEDVGVAGINSENVKVDSYWGSRADQSSSNSKHETIASERATLGPPKATSKSAPYPADGVHGAPAAVPVSISFLEDIEKLYEQFNNVQLGAQADLQRPPGDVGDNSIRFGRHDDAMSGYEMQDDDDSDSQGYVDDEEEEEDSNAVGGASDDEDFEHRSPFQVPVRAATGDAGDNTARKPTHDSSVYGRDGGVRVGVALLDDDDEEDDGGEEEHRGNLPHPHRAAPKAGSMTPLSTGTMTSEAAQRRLNALASSLQDDSDDDDVIDNLFVRQFGAGGHTLGQPPVAVGLTSPAGTASPMTPVAWPSFV